MDYTDLWGNIVVDAWAVSSMVEKRFEQWCVEHRLLLSSDDDKKAASRLFGQSNLYLPMAEVGEILFCVIQKKVSFCAVHRTWDEIWAGNVTFYSDGYWIVIFNDSDDLDYIDSVLAPDGRFGTFDIWYDNNDTEGNLPFSQEEWNALYAICKQAPVYEKAT